jgi:predicted ATP-grasp superfamily ATP-dependent carboligase
MSKGVVVFSGYNQRAVIALLRTLAGNDIHYKVIASSPNDTIFQTAYGEGAIIRRRADLDIDDLLDSLSRATGDSEVGSYLIAPSTESLNRHLLSNRTRYEAAGYEIPLVDEALYVKISDKASFTDMCREAGIRVPSDVASIDEAQLPFVAKPSVYMTASGSTPSPVIIHTAEEHESFVSNNDQADFYYQEYISGESHYLLYYIHLDGRIDKLSQQNLVQQPAGKSIVAAVTNEVSNLPISRDYEKLLLALGYRGLVMIEIKKNDSGEYLMIEANPRMWGPSQLFVDAGKNLFESLLADYGVIDHALAPKGAKENTRYYWGGGAPAAGVGDDGLDYHGYDIDKFRQEKARWESADIYNREDTSGLYESEIKGI